MGGGIQNAGKKGYFIMFLIIAFLCIFSLITFIIKYNYKFLG